MTIDIFHNFVLGMPYQAAELLVNREAIIRCLAPGDVDKSECFMGVDNGIEKHWVLGNRYGIFAYGKTEDWTEIEGMIRRYNATTVIDANPYPNVPKKLARTYRGKVSIHYYLQDSKTMDVSNKGERDNYGVVKTDRTQIFDQLAADITSETMVFYLSATALDDYIYHWENMYRIVEETPQKLKRGKWETKENRPDHWAHATAYWRVAVGQSLASDESGAVRDPVPIKKKGLYVDPQTKTVPSKDVIDIQQAITASTNQKRRIE